MTVLLWEAHDDTHTATISWDKNFRYSIIMGFRQSGTATLDYSNHYFGESAFNKAKRAALRQFRRYGKGKIIVDFVK